MWRSRCGRSLGRPASAPAARTTSVIPPAISRPRCPTHSPGSVAAPGCLARCRIEAESRSRVARRVDELLPQRAQCLQVVPAGVLRVLQGVQRGRDPRDDVRRQRHQRPRRRRDLRRYFGCADQVGCINLDPTAGSLEVSTMTYQSVGSALPQPDSAAKNEMLAAPSRTDDRRTFGAHRPTAS